MSSSYSRTLVFGLSPDSLPLYSLILYPQALSGIVSVSLSDT